MKSNTTKLLLNGCIVYKNEPICYKKMWVMDNGDKYELKHKCNNNFCINENHINFLITHDKGLVIDHTANEYSQCPRLLPWQVKEIKQLLREGKSIRDIAKQYNTYDMKVLRIKKTMPEFSRHNSPSNGHYYGMQAKKNVAQLCADYDVMQSYIRVGNKHNISGTWAMKLIKQYKEGKL